MQESLEEEVIEVVEGGYADHRKDDFDLQDKIIEKRIDDRHESLGAKLFYEDVHVQLYKNIKNKQKAQAEFVRER